MAKPDAEYRRAVKNNEAFFVSLTRAVYRSGKVVAGTMAARALVAAMDNTYHDSSRAAANWELEVDGANARGHKSDTFMPDTYGDSSSAIGWRDSAGEYKGMVIGRKKTNYGITGKGTDAVMGKGGWLWRAIRVGEKGTPAIKLWSPLGMIPAYARNAL